MIAVLQIITTETVPAARVIPFVEIIALGLVIAGAIIFYILYRRAASSLGQEPGQEDSWLQE